MKSSLVTQKLILDTLKKDTGGLMILQIAEKTGINRLTASKYLAVLDVLGYVKHRTVGRARLYFPGPRLKRGQTALKEIKEFS